MHLLYCGKTHIIFTLLTIFSLHFHIKIFIGLQWLYNVVLVSTVQQSESATHIYISPSLPSLPPTYPSPHQVITEHWAEPPVLYSSFPLAVFHMVVYIHVIANLPIHPTMPHVHTSVLYVYVSLSALQTLTFYSVTVRSIATTQRNKLQAKPAL